MMGNIHQLTKKGPRTLVATVVDTAFHLKQGYVTATTELGVVNVFSVPYGTVVPQMRILVRQMGGHATNRAYVFDGYAPNLSSLATGSGSMLQTANNNLTNIAIAPGSISCNTSVTSATGYYWHFFFYVPQIPITDSVLWQWYNYGGTTNTITMKYLTTGQLLFMSEGGVGYITSKSVPPHYVHYVQIQPGYTSNEFLVDGAANYVNYGGGPPVFVGGTNVYGGYFFIGTIINTLSVCCPPGTWISKFGFGSSWTGSAIVPLSTSVPTQDSELPSTLAFSSSTNTSYYQILCGDSIGNTTILNSAEAGAGSPGSPFISYPSYAEVSAIGPY